MPWIDEPLEFGKPQPYWLQLWSKAPVKVAIKDYAGKKIFEATEWSKRRTRKSIGEALEKGKPIAPFAIVNGEPDFRTALVLPWREAENPA